MLFCSNPNCPFIKKTARSAEYSKRISVLILVTMATVVLSGTAFSDEDLIQVSLLARGNVIINGRNLPYFPRMEDITPLLGQPSQTNTYNDYTFSYIYDNKGIEIEVWRNTGELSKIEFYISHTDTEIEPDKMFSGRLLVNDEIILPTKSIDDITISLKNMNFERREYINMYSVYTRHLDISITYDNASRKLNRLYIEFPESHHPPLWSNEMKAAKRNWAICSFTLLWAYLARIFAVYFSKWGNIKQCLLAASLMITVSFSLLILDSIHIAIKFHDITLLPCLIQYTRRELFIIFLPFSIFFSIFVEGLTLLFLKRNRGLTHRSIPRPMAAAERKHIARRKPWIIAINANILDWVGLAIIDLVRKSLF